ncbi:hypothetical protein TRIUR3_25527 [Triticum urartu]|uniref:Uncharacterized protein n=1 Tax=Triticum urartu TaxID=4572 RepID=M7ZKZ7_TRIUA|nr:hypothetical protein TRIUR3_25527 [Triticum urartu]
MAPGRRQSGRTGSVMLGGAAAGTGHRRERVGSFRLASYCKISTVEIELHCCCLQFKNNKISHLVPNWCCDVCFKN